MKPKQLTGQNKLLWVAGLWQDVAAWGENLGVKVRHVDAQSQTSEEYQNNGHMDKAAKTEVA